MLDKINKGKETVIIGHNLTYPAMVPLKYNKKKRIRKGDEKRLQKANN